MSQTAMVAPRFGVISSMFIPIGGTLANIVLFNLALYSMAVFPVKEKCITVQTRVMLSIQNRLWFNS